MLKAEISPTTHLAETSYRSGRTQKQSDAWIKGALQFFQTYLIYWVLPIAILIGWEFIVRSGIVSSRIVPAPFDVVLAAVKLIQKNQLLPDVAVSTVRAL